MGRLSGCKLLQHFDKVEESFLSAIGCTVHGANDATQTKDVQQRLRWLLKSFSDTNHEVVIIFLQN